MICFQQWCPPWSSPIESTLFTFNLFRSFSGLFFYHSGIPRRVSSSTCRHTDVWATRVIVRMLQQADLSNLCGGLMNNTNMLWQACSKM
uniref:Uncharacterized protein n=1 Tax=Periophthalmus magnuspinnatus TaxID=409849 RepID=A0A3B4B2A2_9GOBI